MSKTTLATTHKHKLNKLTLTTLANITKTNTTHYTQIQLNRTRTRPQLIRLAFWNTAKIDGAAAIRKTLRKNFTVDLWGQAKKWWLSAMARERVNNFFSKPFHPTVSKEILSVYVKQIIQFFLRVLISTCAEYLMRKTKRHASPWPQKCGVIVCLCAF